MSWEEAGEILFYACAVPVNLYVFFYAFRPWQTTQQGRALMVKAFGNAFIVDLVVAYLLFGDYPLRDVLRFVGMLVFFVGITYLLLSLLLSPGADRYPPQSWVRTFRRKQPRHRADS